MDNPNSIFSMTEHAAYVWPSYAVVTVVLVAFVVTSLMALRRTQHELERTEAALGKGRDEKKA